MLPKNAAEVLDLVASTTFRDFDDSDWMTWSGCNSKYPKIAEVDDHLVIILDGEAVAVFDEEGFVEYELTFSNSEKIF